MRSFTDKSKTITIYLHYYWWEVVDIQNLLRANEYFCSLKYVRDAEYNFGLPCSLALTRYIIEYFVVVLNNGSGEGMISDVPSFMKLVEQVREVSVYFNEAYNDIEFL